MQHSILRYRGSLWIVIFLLSACSPQPTPGFSTGKRSKDENSTDLPPAGTRSLFDYLVAKNDGKIPYPFEELLALIKKVSGSPPRGTLIPLSRSLQKTFSNFTSPRVVIGATGEQDVTEKDLGFLLKERLYIGFSSKARALEIISYNEKAGRYEFQVVKNYAAGVTPELYYVPRAKCLSCHHAAGPRFSADPWRDTPKESMIKNPLMRIHKLTLVHGIGFAESRINLPVLDRSISLLAQSLVNLQKIWQQGCGVLPEARACRQKMLAYILEYYDHLSDSVPLPLRYLFQQQCSQNPIILPRSDLSENNTLLAIDPEGAEELKGELSIERIEALADQARHAPLPPEDSPLTELEPDIIDCTELRNDRFRSHAHLQRNLMDGIVGLLTNKDHALLLAAAGNNPKRLASAVSEPELAPVIDAPHLERPALMRALLKNLNGTQDVAACCEDPTGLPPPQLTTTTSPPPFDPRLTPGQREALELLRTYCSVCHAGNGVEHLDFLDAATDFDVWQKIYQNSTIISRLDWGNAAPEIRTMPPANSPQGTELRLPDNHDLRFKILEEIRGEH